MAEISLADFKTYLPVNHGYEDPFLQRILNDARREVEMDGISADHNQFDFLQRLKALALLQQDFATRKGLNSTATAPADSPSSFSLSGAFSVGFGTPKSDSEKIFGTGGDSMNEANSFEKTYQKALVKVRGMRNQII